MANALIAESPTGDFVLTSPLLPPELASEIPDIDEGDLIQFKARLPMRSEFDFRALPQLLMTDHSEEPIVKVTRENLGRLARQIKEWFTDNNGGLRAIVRAELLTSRPLKCAYCSVEREIFEPNDLILWYLREIADMQKWTSAFAKITEQTLRNNKEWALLIRELTHHLPRVEDVAKLFDKNKGTMSTLIERAHEVLR